MPGGGINETNIAQVAKMTGAHEFHMSGRLPQNSEMRFRNPRVRLSSSADAPDYLTHITSAARIRAALEALSQ
jgi:copper homeostasis protein